MVAQKFPLGTFDHVVRRLQWIRPDLFVRLQREMIIQSLVVLDAHVGVAPTALLRLTSFVAILVTFLAQVRLNTSLPPRVLLVLRCAFIDDFQPSAIPYVCSLVEFVVLLDSVVLLQLVILLV